MNDKLKSFGLYLLKTPSSDKSFLYCLVRAIVFFIVLLPLIFVVSLLLLNYSWFINVIALGGIFVGLGSLLFGMISKQVRYVSWCVSKFSFLILVLFWVWAILLPLSFCFVSWWNVSLVSSRLQVPLKGVNGIAIDSKDNIYVSIQSFQRIQVYNCDGAFLKSWSSRIGKEGTHFRLIIDKSDRIHVLDRNFHNIYDVNGNKMSSNEDYSNLKNDNPRQAKDSNGNLYEFAAKDEEEDFYSLYSIVLKTTPEGEKSVMISDPQPIRLIRRLPAIGYTMLFGIFLSLSSWLVKNEKIKI